MKPILIIPPDSVSEDDIKRLNENDICTVVAKDPAVLKFLDPIPAISAQTGMEIAAIKLGRKLLAGQGFQSNGYIQRGDIIKLYVDLLVKGTPLDPAPTAQEVERQVFNEAKLVELRRLAAQEAREQRAKEKAEKAAAKAAAKAPEKK